MASVTAENHDEVDKWRGVAAQLLRAHRHGDQSAFMSAWSVLTDGSDARDMAVSLCFLANKAIDQVISRESADELVDRLAATLPRPAPVQDSDEQARLDAVALLGCVVTDDGEGAQAILRNSPDFGRLFGMLLEVLAVLLPSLDPVALDAFLTAARAWASDPD